MHTVLEKMDRILCDYFGLNETKTTPQLVRNKRMKLTILSTESLKRHSHKIIVKKINCSDFDGMGKENMEKLGVAIGKSIATNLVISFDDVAIVKEK